MKRKKPIKAVVMLSGGLDSLLAARLLLEQGIQVHALTLKDPFSNAHIRAAISAKQLKIPFTIIPKGMDYLSMVEHPKHGYGRALNPCVDCRIYTLKKASKFMKKIGASFIVTGEVLGQRPMSQMLNKILLIEREAGLKGLILRPLSAKLLPPSLPEKEGWVKRSKLLDISGRMRNTQIKLAKKWKLSYASPGGGCLLTEEGFCKKLADLFSHPPYTLNDLPLLKLGRHFRLGKSKLISGRNEEENAHLEKLAEKGDAVILPEFPGPSIIIRNPTKSALEFACALAVYYGKAGRLPKVKLKKGEKESLITVKRKLKQEEVERRRI
ncbi:MAG: tRNA 4-thiouridine(8) synthase ThiI [Candidatus Micrarchaeota archaeon]